LQGVVFVVDALPMIGIVSPVKLQSTASLSAVGLALAFGLAVTLGVEGKVL
jgi:hypothetical protein